MSGRGDDRWDRYDPEPPVVGRAVLGQSSPVPGLQVGPFYPPTGPSIPVGLPLTVTPPKGCICPPRSEETCRRSDCGRRDPDKAVERARGGRDGQ